MNRVLRPELGVFVGTWLLAAVAFRSRAFVDPGALWHVRVGELILSDGIMRTDPFTFPFAGKTWIPQQWLGEVLMALLHRAGGLDAMLLGVCVLLAAVATMLFRRLRAGGMGTPLAAGVAGFAVVAAGFHVYARPHLATIAVTAVTAAFLVDFDRRRIGVGRLARLVPLFVLWTNAHGGMLGGLMMLGVCAAAWVARPGIRFGLVLVCVGCGLAMFVNPIGLELQWTWFRIIGSPAMAAHVAEHSPLDLARPGDQAVVAFAAVFLFVLAGARPRDARITWLLPLVWLALTVRGVRQGPLFVMTSAVVMADVWPHTRWHRYLLTHGDSLARVPGSLPSARVAFATLAVALALGLQAAGVRVPVVGAGWAFLDPRFVPTDLADEVARLPAGSRVYNDANFGGFLIAFAPQTKIFMDDRFELCGDAWLENYVDVIENRPPAFDDWYNQYQFPFALVATADPPPALEAHLRATGHWQPVARGRTAALYRRAP